MKGVLKILGIIAGAFLAFIGLVATLAGEIIIGVVFLAVGGLLIYFLARKSPEERAAIAAEKSKAAAARAKVPESNATAPVRPQKKRSKAGGVFLVVLGVCIAFVGFSMSWNRAPGKSSTAANGPQVVSSGNVAAGSSGEKVGDSFGPGDTVEVNGVRITFHGITETMGRDFFVPADGKVFVIADFTIENNTGEQINISGFFGSEAYCDSYLVQQSMNAELADPQGRDGLTGSIASGRKLRGIIGYEVPSQWQTMEISISTDWWRGSRADVITFSVQAI